MKTAPAPSADSEDDLPSRVENREADSMPATHPDFSLVLGGPLFQLLRRAHLSGDALELVHLRILVITLFAWLPLLLLSLYPFPA